MTVEDIIILETSAIRLVRVLLAWWYIWLSPKQISPFQCLLSVTNDEPHILSISIAIVISIKKSVYIYTQIHIISLAISRIAFPLWPMINSSVCWSNSLLIMVKHAYTMLNHHVQTTPKIIFEYIWCFLLCLSVTSNINILSKRLHKRLRNCMRYALPRPWVLVLSMA